MDRLNQLRTGDEAGRGDSTLDTSSPLSEAFVSANESSSKYFSLADSTFDITPIKDVSLASVASTVTEADRTMSDADELISDLSSITKKDVMLDSYKIGKQIEAANILSGGVEIFDDNENSFDGDELVIDDNVELDEKSNLDKADSQFKGDEIAADATLVDSPMDVASKDTEVVLQIDGKNVDAIDIGNGLYLYRKDGQEELAAVQIITEDDQQQPSFKFLKVRENAEGNLEVYEEFEIEVTKEVSAKESQSVKKTPHVPIKEINRVISDATSNKVAEKKDKTPPEVAASTSAKEDTELKQSPAESKTELNLNGKMMKFSESRKSPVVGSFTPMTYHSTPNKEGKPLTKTMVDLQLHPSRHSDNVKKTIEVHTDSQNKKLGTDEGHKLKPETLAKKYATDNIIINEIVSTDPGEDTCDVIGKSEKDLNLVDSSTSHTANIIPLNKSSPSIDDISKKLPGQTMMNVECITLTKIEDIVPQDTGYLMQSLPKNAELEMQVTDKIAKNDHKPISSTSFHASSVTSSTHEIAVDMKISKNIINASEETYAEKLLTKDVAKSVVKEVNKDTITVLQSKDVDQIMEKSQGIKINEQKVDSTICEKDSNIATSSTIDKESSTQNLNITNLKPKEDIILQKESSCERQNEVSSTLLPSDQAQKPLQPTLNPKDSKVKNIIPIDKEKKIPIIPSVSTKAETALKKLCQGDEFAIGANMKLKETVPTPTLKEGNSNQSKMETVLASAMKNIESNQVHIKGCVKETNLKSDAKVDKLIEPKTISKTESGKVTADIAANTMLKIESSNSILKNKPTTISKIDKSISVAMEIVSKPDSVKLKTEILSSVSSEIDLKGVLNVEKNIPLFKEIEQKTVAKSEKLSSVAKDPPKSVSMPKNLNSVPKTEPKNIGTDTPKTVLKTERAPLVDKEIVPKIPSKTEMFKPIESKIDPKFEANLEKLTPVGNDILKTKNEVVAVKTTNNLPINKVECASKETRILEVMSNSGANPTNNNHAAVPFGKWTDANRQEFLNKFKEIKAPAPSNTKQIKNSNDLNRIDVLKKIDSQRSNNASSKSQDKSTVKEKDSVFSNKIVPPKLTKIPVKNEGPKIKPKPETVTDSKSSKEDSKTKEKVTSSASVGTSSSDNVKPDSEERRNVNVNMTNLITRTIVDMLNRPVPMTMYKSSLSEPKPRSIENTDVKVTSGESHKNSNSDLQKIDEDSSGSLDDIEMKMNELHGIPFVERPPHELPRVYKTYSKTSKDTNVANKVHSKTIVAPTTSKQNLIHNIIDVDSDEEIIEHEPVTGDIDLSKKKAASASATHVSDSKTAPTSKEPQNKDPVITEKDFDKFARRNSITYENCLTVKFDGKEPANVVQTVKEKEAKLYPRNEITRMDANMKLPPKQYTSQNVFVGKVSNASKFGTVSEDPNSKNYQSKIATAYQSALNSKRQVDGPITIIEDKPVKVVFMDANLEFVPNQLNVQGKELSPSKKADSKVETTVSAIQSVNIDMTEAVDDNKQLYDMKIKTKHQRKQVLTPVEAPELELIQSGELGIDVSPKKKRKTDDSRIEKNPKHPLHKKQYLLGRGTVTNEKSAEINHPTNETANLSEIVPERSAVSAIDSLVKAAEMLETQSVHNISANPDSQQNTPVKRGRGRPRKYPLPEGATNNKLASPSPQKKPRLIDAKPIKDDSVTDENDSTDEEDNIRENWTMGKINENIVCPICNKLFRSENVVFKHVKHCTGVSPSRSDSDKVSPHRRRNSQESDGKCDDMDVDEKPSESVEKTPKKGKSNESVSKHEEKIGRSENEIIVIEDTPVKDQIIKITKEKSENPKKEVLQNTIKEPTNKKEIVENKAAKMKKLTKTHFGDRSSDLVCEFCGKTFRQLSYLVNHKIQHRKEQIKKPEIKATNKLQVFSCEICKKEFRKLHHLVQHRIIHNPQVPTRTLRKSSSEQSENKNVREQAAPKQNDDASAGFRCEPCDKSFRKLHHLVEHRETHDGINRQKNTTAQAVLEKIPPLPTCEVCKKTFRKLNQLIEHKEQHVEQVETSSEKSDDKSVKSSLSTKDIIHECSLCYMVFPNEHSLNKHFVICQQKKKRQSKQKEKPANVDDPEKVEECNKSEESLDEDSNTLKTVAEDMIVDREDKSDKESKPDITQKDEDKVTIEKPVNIEIIPEISKVSHSEVPEILVSKEKEDKTPVTDKVAPTTKRQKSTTAPLPTLPEGKPVESSDDDEVRYMLNPDFEVKEMSEEKTFMTVRSNKRNSLQIERPNSRDLMKRRTSLQHPPKIPRLKAKAVEPKVVPTVTKNVSKLSKSEAASTDSDDSDVKYSFPDKVPQQTSKPIPGATPKEKKAVRKSLAEKRKSLSGIAKRKSTAQTLVAKLKPNPSPVRLIKRRTLDVEYRCDCGQLFKSAAMLTRHTSLAHTPPRIRCRRSPPPDESIAKPARKASENPPNSTRKFTVKSKVKPTRKSSVKSDSAQDTRKSSDKSKSTSDTRKSIKLEQSTGKGSSAKPKRNPAHRGVPVPEKLRKLGMKIAK